MYLLNRHTVKLLRMNGVTNYDINGDLVVAEREPFQIKGLVLPYRERNSKSREQLVLPNGTRLSDMQIFYTKYEVRTSSNFGSKGADVIIYKGIEYEAFSYWDFSDLPLEASHYSIVLIRRDNMNAKPREA